MRTPTRLALSAFFIGLALNMPQLGRPFAGVLCVLAAILTALWPLLAWGVKLYAEGLLLGWGARSSGVLRRQSQKPRRSPYGRSGRRLTQANYFPWNDEPGV
jgi:hypothetical protein